MRVKSSAAIREFLESANPHFGEGEPPGGDAPPPRPQLNALLALSFRLGVARRYLVSHIFVRPVIVKAEDFCITGMLRRFDVEHVRRTGRLTLKGSE